MNNRGAVSREIVDAARDRVERVLQQKRHRGERVVSLTELAEETAMDPNTAAAVMDDLTRQQAAPCRQVLDSEVRWYITIGDRSSD